MATPNEKSFKTLTLSDNEPENILELHQNGAYRSIKCRAILNMTNSGSAPTFKEDDILNYFKNVAVRINGKKSVHNLPLKLHHFVEQTVKGAAPKKVDPVTTVSTTYDAIVNFTIDFAENKLNEFDRSALLQTKNLTNLELVVATGDKDDIASANAPTINSAKIETATRYYTGPEGKASNINDDNEVQKTKITETSEEKDLETDRTIFDKKSQDISLVAGSAILESGLLVTDNGIRSDDRVTDFKFKTVKPSEQEHYESTFKNAHDKNIDQFAMKNEITGFVFHDWREFFESRSGLVTGARTNDILQLLTNGIVSGEDKIQIYTRSV